MMITDNEEKEKKIIPSIFAESIYKLDGRPFRLTDRHYLKPIYDGGIENGMIMSGRQVEKSTTNSTHIANHMLLMPNFKGLYFAPLTSQVKEFSNERLGKLFEYSQLDVIKREFIDKKDSQAVFLKEIKKTNSTIYLKHCYGLGDNIRGITVNGIWGDEIQDIHIDALPVIKECQAHALEAGSRNRVTWYTGTPKTYSNTIQQKWDQSSQAEWVVKCPHCNTYQVMGIKNLTPDKFVCRKCKMELPKRSIINGLWVEKAPKREFKGFRISQLMVPWITTQDIWTKYTDYSADKFHNEVLGRSYENAEKPFTALELEKISANNLKLYGRAEGEFANRKVFMGVDWGTGERSFTVVSIYSRNNNGKFQLLYIKRYAVGEELDWDNYQFKHICMLFQLFNVTFAIVDWGFVYEKYKKLQSVFGIGRVSACYYSFNQKDRIKYDQKQARWIVNRTQVMQEYVVAVKKEEIVWPGGSRSEFSPWLYDHHLCEQAEYRKSEKTGRSEDLMYTHPEGQPDDCVHSGVYAKLAEEIYNKSGNGSVVFSGVNESDRWNY